MRCSHWNIFFFANVWLENAQEIKKCDKSATRGNCKIPNNAFNYVYCSYSLSKYLRSDCFAKENSHMFDNALASFFFIQTNLFH